MKENEESARKFLQMFKLVGVALLALNVYWYCVEHNTQSAGIEGVFVDAWFTLLRALDEGLYLFHSPYVTLISAVFVFFGTSFGDKAVQTKERKFFGRTYEPTHELGMKVAGAGLLIILICPIALLIPLKFPRLVFYIILILCGFLPFIFGLAIYTATPKHNLSRKDPFNKREQSNFKQIETYDDSHEETTFHFPTKYYYLNEERHGWINLEAPFRATIVLGTPGAGKSFTIINNYIRQAMAKGFAMYLYDFKVPDLSEIAYSNFMWNKPRWAELYNGVTPKYGLIDFNTPTVSVRCNPIAPKFLPDLSDAQQIAEIISFNLARTWIEKQGDFFVESAKNFIACAIWFLRQYEGGRYCTFPHVIDLMCRPVDEILTIFACMPDLNNIAAPFLNAWASEAVEQIQGQMASAQILISRVSSPLIYWSMSGDDIEVDMNDPLEPKLLCFGNDPKKKDVYGIALSIYTAMIVNLSNSKGKNKCCIVVDELPTMFINGLDNLIATARSNEVAVLLGFQDFAQLEADYKKANAEKIIKTVGNYFCGNCNDETAEKISKRLGKSKQQKESISISDNGTSFSISEQMEYFVPPERIAQAPQGWFCGLVCNNAGGNADEETRVFAAQIDIDVEACIEEEKHYLEIPEFYNFDDEVVASQLREIAEAEDFASKGFDHTEFSDPKELTEAMLRYWFDRNEIEKEGFDHRQYKTLSTLIRKVLNPNKHLKKFIFKYRQKDPLFNKILEIRNKRMMDYINNNRENIRQEVENICVAELDRIKELAEKGEPTYKKIWETRLKTMGERQDNPQQIDASVMPVLKDTGNQFNDNTTQFTNV